MLAPRRATALTALLVVLAVATILISPDPTDDVDGVWHSHKPINTPAQLSFPNLTETVFTHFRSLRLAASAESFRLLYGLRC